jgi:hypothetical protein
MERGPLAREHATRQRNGRQEIAALRMTIGSDL